MFYDVILERNDDSYMATVPALPGLQTIGRSREEVLVAVKSDIAHRLAEAEVVEVEVEGAAADLPYSASQMALARAAARQRGEPNAPLTGKPWLDFAGYLSHLSDEYWEEYQTALKAIREEEDTE
jgi:hypothetical protein